MPMTTAQQTDAYRFFAIAFNAAPGVEYMNQIASAYDSGATTKQIVNEFTKKSVFTSAYPLFLTNEQFASRLIDNVVGTSATTDAKTEAKADVVAALAAGSSRGDVIFQVFSNLAGLTGDAKWGNVALKMANQVATSQYYTETLGRTSTDITTLQAVLAGVDHTTTVTTAALDARLNPPPAGQTFTLTTGVDAVTGTAGNDTINSNVASFGALDVIAGGAGTDTLNVVDAATAFTGFGGATISGIETVNINTGGAVGAIAVAAGSTAAAGNPQSRTINFADPSVATGYDVTIGGNKYTTAAATYTTGIAAANAVETVLKARLQDSVNITNDGNGTLTLTSKVAGQAQPSISIARTIATSGAITISTVDANAPASAPVAVAQTATVTMSAPNAGDTYVVSIGGADYSGSYTGTSAVSAAADIAAVINAVLGAGTATLDVANSPGVIALKASTAGAALPSLNIRSDRAGVAQNLDSVVWGVAPASANAAAVSAVTVAAPTGTTSYTVSAAGDANVSGATTTAMSVTAAGGSAQVTGGSSVTVVASGSVGVYSATGAPVSITATSPQSSSFNGVISNPGTGNTATYANGIYVTGGTTVNITQAGASISSGAAGTIRNNSIQVGVEPSTVVSTSRGTGTFAEASKSPSSNAFFNSVAGLSSDPTGNVTITAQTTYTAGTTGVNAGRSAVAYGTTAQKVFVNGADTVSLTGLSTATITDVNTTIVQKSATDTTGSAFGTSKLATVNLTGLSNAATIKSDAIATVNVLNATGSAAVTIANSGTTGANSGAFSLTVGNSTVTVTNSTATSVNVGSTTTSFQTLNGTAPVLNTNALTLNAGAATSLNFTNANTITLTNGGLAKVASVAASGAGNLTLGTIATGWDALTSINASAKSGNVAVTLGATPALAGMSVTTGSGNDAITLTGDIGSTNGTGGGLVATTLSLGAGNDRVMISNTVAGGVVTSIGAVSAGASIDAGDGIDVVSARLVTAGNAAIFRNFERVDVTNAVTGGSLDASLLTNSTISGVRLSGSVFATAPALSSALPAAAAPGSFTVSNLAGTTINIDVADTSAVNLTANLATATGTADTAQVNFAYSGTGASSKTVTVTGITTTGIENLSISSAGTQTNTTTFDALTVSNVLTQYTDTGNTLKTITLTGANLVSLGSVAVTRNATSGVPTAATWTTDGVAQQTVAPTTAPTANVASSLTSIDASSTTGGVNIYAGVSDAIAGGSGFSTVYTGLTITGGSGADALRNDAASGITNGGAGNDWLEVGGDLGTANGGTGDDTLTARSTNVTLTGGGGKDTFVINAAANTGSASTPNITTITDWIPGDVLQLGQISTLTKAQTSIASATTLLEAFDLALKNVAVTGNNAAWFTYGGNTYVVREVSGDGLGTDDVIVKLNGVIDLTSATIGGAGTAGATITGV